MPLGPHGYEHEPIEEEEPERERRFNVIMAGLWLLGLAALAAAIAFVSQFASPPTRDPYTRAERNDLKSWFEQHDSTDWLKSIRSNVEGGRVLFEGNNAEVRIYRVGGMSFNDCVDKLRSPLQLDGFTPAINKLPSTGARKNVLDSRTAFESQNRNARIDIAPSNGGMQVLIREQLPPSVSASDWAEIRKTFSFDPSRDIADRDWRELAP